MNSRYKYHIYPNQIQMTKLNQLFRCCRYVWNSTFQHREDVNLIDNNSIVKLS
ncbi:MAG: helix-turn-helix domain-containing protein [Trichodesmium sp. St16_bin2-tuft]|nr:helix-turn-helix domain-containing protein [Trichodesmium sp. St16_bin2-tuft]MDE5112428.1 helix-turn-helix domain-containing protein [Trichodesmium sp. St7_bin2_1]MDE5117600.1 helix-turn-helix domain-containing protein [Trichodesmium sp. St2_bin2_1]